MTARPGAFVTRIDGADVEVVASEAAGLRSGSGPEAFPEFHPQGGYSHEESGEHNVMQ